MSEGKSSGDERRRFTRADVLLRIEYAQPGDFLADYITNLNEGGIFICTNLDLSLGQEIAFTISLPGLLKPLDLRGVVRWRRAPATPDDTAEPTGIGVEFSFPDDATREQVAELVACLRRDDLVAAAPEREPFRVLLVEDNDFVQEMFLYAVERFHHERGASQVLELFSASDGQEALKILAETRVDLAIVDHFLPGISGCMLVERIRKDERLSGLPIVVISIGGEEVKREALRLGADLYLDKPVMLKQLIATMEALVARRGE